ncbi:MAG: hypothetical protein WCJ73_10890, partial [Actinomycetes bacterium]
TGSRWWFTLAVIGQIVTCSFSDRGMLIPLAAGVLLFVTRRSGSRPSLDHFSRDIRAVIPMFAALMGVVLVQLALTLLLAKTETTPALTVALSTNAGVWREVVMYWWGIGVASVAINSFAKVVPALGSTGVTPTGVFGLAVLAMTAVLTVRTTRAALAWLCLIVLVTLSGIQIAFGKLANASPQLLGSVPRYQDLTVILLATLIPAGWAVSNHPWPKRRSVSIALLFMPVMFSGFWILNLRRDVQLARPHSLVAGAYASNLRSSLARWNRSGEDVTLLNERIPNEIVLAVPATQGYNFVERAVRVVARGVDPISVNSIRGRALRVDAGGTLRSVRLGPSRNAMRRGSGCGHADASARWGTLGGFSVAAHIPQSVTRSGLPTLLRVKLAGSSVAGSVGVVPQGGWPMYEGLPLSQFGDGFRVVIPNQTVDIDLQLWAGAKTCITSVGAAPILFP